MLYEAAHLADRARRLRNLQALAAETPQPSDLIAGWYDPLTVEQLHRVGPLTLADLRQRIGRGEHWWSAVPDQPS